MNCAELRQRIVDPASSTTGGHAPVVEHIQSCAPCRTLARTFAEIEKLFGSLESGALPGDFDERVRRRLRHPGSRLSALVRDRRWLAAAALLVFLGVIAAFLWPRSSPRTPPTAPPGGAAPAAGLPEAKAPPPDILAVRSTPIAMSSTPIEEAEKSIALALSDREFLGFVPALTTLDPFFPTSFPAPASSRPPDPQEDAVQRLVEWQDAGPAERARWRQADAAFRARDAPERTLLLSRWRLVSGFSPEEKAGLRRLAARIGDLDAKRRSRLAADLKTLSQAPAADRRHRWQTLSFARPLTGQEIASGEKLLLSF